MRGRQARRWLTVAIAGELLAAGLIGTLAWSWPLEEFSDIENLPKVDQSLIRKETGENSLPSLAIATESAKKSLHRPLFDRPPMPVAVKPEVPRAPKKTRPAVKLIGTIADPSGNRGIFETTPEHTEVRRAGERFEQLPSVQVKQIDLEKAVLQVDSEEFEIAIATPPVGGTLP